MLKIKLDALYHLTEATDCPVDLPSAPPFKNRIKHEHKDWKYHTDHVNISIFQFWDVI